MPLPVISAEPRQCDFHPCKGCQGRQAVPTFHSVPDPGGMCILQSSETRSGTEGCRNPRARGPVTPQRPPLGRAPRQPTAQPSARSPRPSASFSPVRSWAVGDPGCCLGGSTALRLSYILLLQFGFRPHGCTGASICAGSLQDL